ncbi:MAG: VWA domain-containing protein [Deltaproteobacteria bacterium]|nr:VWA domain-containing protein [Deltaproteobacteria bacterium]
MERLNAIESDGYDRHVFEAQRQKRGALSRAIERASRLLPHGESLVADVFFVLYKLNVILVPVKQLVASARLNRRLVEAVLKTDGLPQLRARTGLDAATAASATAVIVDKALAALTREYRVGPKALLEIADIAHDESSLAEREGQIAHLDDLPKDAFSENDRANLTASLKAERDELKRRIERAAKAQDDLARRLSTEIEEGVAHQVRQLPENLDQVDAHISGLGLNAGTDGRMSVEARVELGDRLMKSKKLQRLARLVGAFREVAFEARRRRIYRAPQELHSIATSGSLERILPSELIGLNPARTLLHREFMRRYAEGALLAYDFTSPASSGPIVICLDGSGSMQGSKELWAKAVALTLMEIARRERRRCLGLIFSSGHALFEVELLSKNGSAHTRSQIRVEELLRFAEYFPAGGTDFEPPLRRALDLVTETTYRRGDIVFITDGQADVSSALIDDIERARRKHRFRIRALVVDVAQHSTTGLERFADEVRRVSDLAADALTDLFASV